MQPRLLLLLAVTAVCLTATTPAYDQLNAAIRSDDVAAVERLVQSGQDVNSKGPQQVTPLHRAALIGSVKMMSRLIEMGADVNAANATGATPLMWATASPDKVRLLLEKGADVNAKNKQGRTALLIAAANPRGTSVVRMLLAKGADIQHKDELGTTALHAAGWAGNREVIGMLLERGLDPNQADEAGFTPLMNAVSANNEGSVQALLAAKANVNAANTFGGKVKHGDIALKQLTPLMIAAPYGSPQMIRMLLAAGADVNARDSRQMTALMFAVAAETQNPEVVELLLNAKADTTAKDIYGQTAVDWARKFNNPRTLRILGDSARVPAARIVETRGGSPATADIAGSIAAIQKASDSFFKASGCVACHHQNITAFAVSTARAHSVPVDEAAEQELIKATRYGWELAREGMLVRIDPPGGIDMVNYVAMALAMENVEPGDLTDSMVFNIASQQYPDGRWDLKGFPRSPMSDGTFARTAMAVRVLSQYAPKGIRPEIEQQIALARTWLEKNKGKTTDDHAMRIAGLRWAGGSKSVITKTARDLMALQRIDGGWGGNAYMESDAFATGEALWALAMAKTDLKSDAVQRGRQYLVSTRKSDGTWHVASRSPKFQPYFESGFLYGHDQWISVPGTAWAAVGLIKTGGEPANRLVSSIP